MTRHLFATLGLAVAFCAAVTAQERAVDEEGRVVEAASTVVEPVAPPSLEIRGTLESRASLISCDKARRLIGYEPQYTWQVETQDPANADRESER